MQFLNGKIYLYHGADIDMSHNVGTYDDQSVHLLINIQDADGGRLTLKFGATVNAKGGMDATVSEQYISSKFQSQFIDQAVITK